MIDNLYLPQNTRPNNHIQFSFLSDDVPFEHAIEYREISVVKDIDSAAFRLELFQTLISNLFAENLMDRFETFSELECYAYNFGRVAHNLPKWYIVDSNIPWFIQAVASIDVDYQHGLSDSFVSWLRDIHTYDHEIEDSLAPMKGLSFLDQMNFDRSSWARLLAPFKPISLRVYSRYVDKSRFFEKPHGFLKYCANESGIYSVERESSLSTTLDHSLIPVGISTRTPTENLLGLVADIFCGVFRAVHSQHFSTLNDFKNYLIRASDLMQRTCYEIFIFGEISRSLIEDFESLRVFSSDPKFLDYLFAHIEVYQTEPSHFLN